MATRAELFRYWNERSGPKKPPSVRPRRDVAVDTSLPGVSATGKKAQVPRKPSARVAKKAAYVLEETSGTPSRKSTRKAGNRQRTDAQMRVKRRNAAKHL